VKSRADFREVETEKERVFAETSCEAAAVLKLEAAIGCLQVIKRDRDSMLQAVPVNTTGVDRK
jgi:hypothetical protein